MNLGYKALMTPVLCADLHAAIDELSKLSGFEHLAKRLSKIANLSACCADLRFASDCLEALVELRASPRGLNRPSRRATETSLLMSSINLYARATAVAALKGERGSSGVVDQLSPDELRDHETLIEVRHRGLTHITPNAALTDGEVWSEQRALAFATEIGWKVAFSTRNIAFRDDLLATVHRQVPIAQRILDERFQDKIRVLGDALREAPGWDQCLRRHSIDPAIAFGSTENAARAMAPMAVGDTTVTFFASPT
jgi:hypothetical protein